MASASTATEVRDVKRAASLIRSFISIPLIFQFVGTRLHIQRSKRSVG
jgi:hypothetical protein